MMTQDEIYRDIVVNALRLPLEYQRSLVLRLMPDRPVPSAGRPAKPKLGEYPHSLDDCIKYMDFLAITGLADGSRERVGGMCLSTAKHLSRLKDMEGAGRPMTWTRADGIEVEKALKEIESVPHLVWLGGKNEMDMGLRNRTHALRKILSKILPDPETSASESGEPVSGDPAPSSVAAIDSIPFCPHGVRIYPGNGCGICALAPIVEAKADPAQGTEPKGDKP